MDEARSVLLEEMTCLEVPQVPGLTLSAPDPSRDAQHKYQPLSLAATADQLCPPDISRMKLLTGLIFCCLVLGVSGQSWFSFLREAYQGAGDMWRAYSDMKEANWKNSDKYFHARGNYDAAQRGPGGVWAAEVISDAREGIQSFIGSGHEDAMADQEANRWGRSGKDPNHYRPAGLPNKY